MNLPVPSGHAADLVIHNGDTVIGSGQLEARPGQPVRFCDPNAAIAAENDTPCPGIDIVGADLHRLKGRFATQGITYGSATLVGTYRNGTLRVTAQAPPSPNPDNYKSQYIPCKPPAGGWVPITQTLSYGTPWGAIRLLPAQRYGAHHPQYAVKVAPLRASPTAAVAYVLSVDDAATAQIRAALEPTYPKDLCVVKSRYTHSQVLQSQAALSAKVRLLPSAGGSLYAWDSLGSGDDLGPDAQLCITFAVGLMSADLADVIDKQPAGIIQVKTMLRPVKSLRDS